jgi:hypothetical protein
MSETKEERQQERLDTNAANQKRQDEWADRYVKIVEVEVPAREKKAEPKKAPAKKADTK